MSVRQRWILGTAAAGLAVTAVVWLLWPEPSAFPAPVFQTTVATLTRTTVVDKNKEPAESVYELVTMRYVPPVRMVPITRAEASYATPEDTLIAQISAIASADWDWYLETWDQNARDTWASEKEKTGWTAEFWLQSWKQDGLDDKATYYITERGEHRELGYVALLYVAEVGSNRYELPLAVAQRNGKWLATNQFAEEPSFTVGFYARDDRYEVQR